MKHIITLALGLFAISGYSQGLIDGFFKGKGNGAVAVSASFETASKYWAGENQIDFERNMPNAGIFGTYGLLDGLDIVASIPFVNLSPQDASLFLKLRALRANIGSNSNLVLGIAGGMSAPMSNYNTESSTAIGQRATVFEGRAFAQFHLNNTFFIQAQSGYAYALDPVPSFVPLSVKLGITRNNWYADVWFDLRDGETGKDYQGVGDRAPESFRELEVDYQRVGATFYKPFSEKFGMSLGGGYTLSGRNVFQSAFINLGAIWNLSRNSGSAE